MKQPNRSRLIQLSVVALLIFVAACGNRDDTTSPTNNGSIALTLTSPAGVSPSVTIAGPNGYSHTVSSSTTLLHLAAGSYTITADSIVTPSTIVGYSVDTAAITGNPIIVTTAGSSAATVTYSFARQHGALWLANYSGSYVSGFARSQLLASGVVFAADTIGAAQSSGGMAFNSNGDMWTSSDASDTLKMFTLAQRNAANAITAPARVLVSSSLSSPETMAFDAHGNLWVADYDNGLLEFTAAQIAAGGTVSATVVLVDVVPSNAGDYAVAFDSAGNAWVGENDPNNVVEYTVAQLAASGSPTPNVRLGVDPSTASRIVRNQQVATRDMRASGATAFGSIPEPLHDPDAVAFDAHGNLWVANYYNENVVAYSPSQRLTSGNPTPSITIVVPGTEPFGLAFDKSGGLWIGDDSGNTITNLAAASLATSGTPTPTAVLTAGVSNSIDGPQQLAFDEWVVAATPPVLGSRVQYRTSRATHAHNPRKNRQHH